MLLPFAAIASILPVCKASAQASPSTADDAQTKPAGLGAWLRERVDGGGSVRAGAWTSSRNLDDDDARGVAWLWLNGRARLIGQATLRVEGYLGHESLFRGGSLHGFLREAYLAVPLGRLDLRVGRQIIVWGRADGLNPTDSLSAHNFTRLFTDDDDQRQGLADARATLRAGAMSVTGIWLARASTDTVPASPPSPRFVVETAARPRRQPQFALKLERTGSVDWSLSYYDGVHPFPDLGLTLRPPPIPLVWRNHRARVMGADFATVAGRFGLHAEAAYQLTDDSQGVDPFVRNPFVYVVAGADRTFGASLNANLQYVYRQVMHYSDPRLIADPLVRGVAVQSAVVAQQLDRTRNGMTLRLAQKLRHETVAAEVFVAAFFRDGDYVVRPKLSVALTDRFKAIVGGDVFRGPANTFLGRLRTNTVFFSELRYAF